MMKMKAKIFACLKSDSLILMRNIFYWKNSNNSIDFA